MPDRAGPLPSGAIRNIPHRLSKMLNVVASCSKCTRAHISECSGALTFENVCLGPAGLRALLRVTLQLTGSRMLPPYRVNELHDVPFLHRRWVREFN